MNPVELQWKMEQWVKFACATISGVLANPQAAGRSLSQDAAVEAACSHADAMLEALERRIEVRS